MTDPLHDPSFPDRPQHPDFWRLSEIILQLDGRAEEDPDFNVETQLAETVDPDAIRYHILERAKRLRVLLADEGSDFDLDVFATGYLEGFILGNLFNARGGHQDG